MKVEKFVYVLFIFLLSCSTQNKRNHNNICPEGYIPVDIYDAIEYLNCSLSDDIKQKIVSFFENEEVEIEYLEDENPEIEILDDKKLNEMPVEDEDFMLFLFYYDFGRNIRNTWELWSEENDLVHFFNSYEIFHPDDMSSIILTSFYRRMKNKEIDFEGQVQDYLDFRKPYQEFENEEIKRALDAYNNYNLGDTITIYMEMDESAGINTIVGIGPGYEWIFNPEKDLELSGKIIKKEVIKDCTDINLLIHILRYNKKGIVEMLGKKVIIGDTTDFNLKYLRYK